MTIAYEPIWAIGTGLVATAEQAQEAVRLHAATLVCRRATAARPSDVRILYGGSVKPEQRVRAARRSPDVDGALVGGAALDAEDFAAILEAA